MSDTFKCENCGRELPRDQMKEIFRTDGDEQVRMEVDAACLDKLMNEGGDVYGVPGVEKRRAALIDEGGGPDAGQTTGKRE